MDTLEVVVQCPQDLVEILWAELSIKGYDSMMETDAGFNAYIQDSDFDKEVFEYLTEKYPNQDIKITYDLIKKVNWNTEWEKNFEPVYIGDQIYIRADFHPENKDVPFEIVINPKMSFGTGHHDTTYLVLNEMLDMNLEGRRVLDVGCGTGILSIMACKKGAEIIKGLDLDPWAVENSRENALKNGCNKIEFVESELGDLVDKWPPFDVILANINLNYHLQTFSLYQSLLKKNGLILMSGFFTENDDKIISEASEFGLIPIKQNSKNQWSLLVLRHNN